jgi:ribosomal protein L35
MPKLKVHSGTKDRVKVTKGKKILAGSPNNNHFKSKQSAARKRRLSGMHTFGSTNAKAVKQRIGV